MRMFFKCIRYFMLLTITIITTLYLFLVLKSPGKLEDKKDENGNVIKNSISEKIKIDINGVEQGMFIVGENKGNPVLLFLHGGPGNPMYWLHLKDMKALEKIFTVCYWDQRGSGMSYDFKMDDFNLDILVEDTKGVSKYLIERFKKENIYLLGYSWGSYLGVKTIDRYPELYKAYIGIGQVSNQLESEKLAYKYFLEKTIETNDEENLEILRGYSISDKNFALTFKYVGKRSELLNKYGVGVTHKNRENRNRFKDLFLFEGYTATEKIKLIFGEKKSMKLLWKRIMKDNLIENNLEFKVPFYIIHGAYDYQVSYELAKEYFELINAPKKEFFTFDESAHGAFYEEKYKFIEVMDKIKLENEKIKESEDNKDKKNNKDNTNKKDKDNKKNKKK